MRTWFSSNSIWDIFRKVCWIFIQWMWEKAYFICIYHFAILITETEWLVHIGDLRNLKVMFWMSYLLGHFVFEIFCFIWNAAPTAPWKLTLYLMWTFANILGTRVIEFGYWISLDQTPSVIFWGFKLKPNLELIWI